MLANLNAITTKALYLMFACLTLILPPEAEK
jgi:hypothetical protein